MFTKFVIILFAFIIVGCSSISGTPERSVDIESELETLQAYFAPNVITTYNAKSSNAEKRSYRNEVLSARVRAIDLNFNEFVKDISSENKKLNIGADSTVLLLGALGAVSTVSSSQAIISATSATVTGVKSSIDKNAYYDSTLTAIVSQMQANRQKQLVAIYTGMELDIASYSLMRALIDVENYFQVGTVIGAVNEINKQAGELKAEADEEISMILKSSYKKDKAGDLIRSYWKPDGKVINTANQDAIKSWMKTNNLDNVSITFFLRSELFSDAREKAVADIPIQ
ncbi:hypothetical protein [Aliiglaciecola litoralis]|uniref:Lipoprotein n=1 Tax=Aliiglaciecola litoralis TaxID=582857 RepID=A0ABN1LC47_9ALTE